MDTTSDDNSEYLSDNNGADDRDSLGGLSGDLGQVLPDAPPKCDDPKVAVAVLAYQQGHRDAVFDSHDGRAARKARVAVSATIAGADWSEWLAGGEKALSFVDPPATKKRPTAKTPPSAGPKARDSARRAASRPYGKSPPKVSEN